MIKTINFAGSVTTKEYSQTPSEKSLTLYVSDKHLPEWCLNLHLLSKGRLEAVHLISGLKQDILLKRANGHKNRSGEVSWRAAQIQLMAPKTTLDYWFDWISSYYIEGVSPVNHIDWKFEGQEATNKSLNLIVCIRVVAQ